MADSNPEREPKNTADTGRSPETEDEAAPMPVVLPEPLVGDLARLELAFPGLDARQSYDQLDIVLSPERLPEVAGLLRDELGYRMLMSISATDWKDRFEVVYHLYRLDSAYPIILRYDLPHEENPEAPSLMPIWPGADFQEREIFDLMGIVFTGHPDLRRILLADDFQGHPLRKDFQQDPDYVLVPHLRVPGYRGARSTPASTGRFLPDEETP